MKRLAFMFMFCVLGSLSAFAQEQGEKQKKTPEQRAEKRLTRLTKQLELSSDQVSKLKPALITKITKVQAAKATDNKEAIKAAQKAYREVLRATLTKEQFKKHKALKKKKKEKRKEKRSKRKEY